MSFFEPPPSPPPVAMAAVEYRQPAWLGPPANVLPGVVPVELLIARTDETAVALTGIRAYPTGFGFTVSLRMRRLSFRQQDPYPFDAFVEGDQVPDAFLRFGVQFADGAKATNFPRYDLHHDPETEPAPPVLTAHGGGGGGTVWDADHWVWPLPPAGPLAFVCEWPARQIGESRVELDARLVRQAAERATTLWPDDEPFGT